MLLLNRITFWVIRIMLIFWSVFIILDYIYNHPYISESIRYFAYWDLLLLCLFVFCLFVFRVVKRKGFRLKSIQFYKLNGLKVMALFYSFLIIIFLVYGKHTSLFDDNSAIKILYFSGYSVLQLLYLLIIVVVGYGIGSVFINNTLFSNLTYRFVSIAIGWIFLTLAIFFLSVFNIYLIYSIGIVFLIIILVRWKSVFEFLREVFVKNYQFNEVHIIDLIPVFLILLFFAHNFISMLKPFPTGFDASNLYVNISNLMNDYNGLVSGGQAYNWSVFMSLGIVLFKSTSLTLLLSTLPGMLSVILVFLIAKRVMTVRLSLFASFFFYSLPLILFHSTVDAKVDLALLFFSLIIVLIVVEKYSIIKKSRKLFEPVIGIIAVLLGFSFGIKYTSIFMIFSFISVYFYLRIGKIGFTGVVIIFISLLYLLRLYDFTWLLFDESNIEVLSVFLLILGVLIISYVLFLNRDNFRVSLIQLSFVLGVIFILFLPWAGKHIIENKDLSMHSILYGKSSSPNLKLKTNESKLPLQYFQFLDYPSFLNEDLSPLHFSTQKNPGKKYIKAGSKNENTAKYEEVNRYSGYETGFVKYLSLLYDITMAKNVNLMHTNISWFLLLFLPLIVFGRKQTSYWKDIIRLLGLIVVLILSVLSVYINDGVVVTDSISNMSESNLFGSELLVGIYEFLLLLILTLGNTLVNIYHVLTIDNYLLIVISILISFVLIYLWFRLIGKAMKIEFRILAALSSSYFFFWFLIGGGIIWYALPAIVLVIIIIFASYDLSFKHDFVLKYIFYGSLILWTFISVSLVFSNHDNNNKQMSDMIYFDYFASYFTGDKDYYDVMDKITPAYPSALLEINANESKVYLVGTYINYHIRFNDKRVVMDNQLSKFDRIYSSCETLRDVTDIFKINRFKYLIVDLGTASLDKTPEKSLVTKFNKLMYYVTRSGDLKLISTDRIIKSEKSGFVRISGQKIRGKFSMDEGDVVYPGRIAVYEIL